MSPDPLALVPLAVAANGGRLGAYDAQQLVAAGFQLLRRCAPLVRALEGRRAAILLPSGPEFLVALAACEGRGAVLMNPLVARAEIVHQLDNAGVGAVFTTSGFTERLPSGVPRVLLDDAPESATWLAGGESRTIDLGTHAGFPLAGERGVPGREEEAVVVYTSAMAGTPLGAILTHKNLLANAHATVEAGEFTEETRSLAVLPFAHLFGLTVTLNAPLLAGGTVVPVERFSPPRALEMLESERITLLVGVPAVFAALAAAIERRGGARRPDALRTCICGGAPLSVGLQERWLALTGVDLRQGYGLTEASPVCLFNRVSLPNRPGTLGVAYPGVEVVIRDPESGGPIPAGREGEICVTGDNLFAGYVRGSGAGLQVRDGWLYTGDVGVMDDDQVVTFKRVLKPMFTRNGFNIYPREIERALAEMPGVRSVAVRAVASPARENDIAVTVRGAVTADEVRAWCEDKLSAYKQPSEIEVTGDG